MKTLYIYYLINLVRLGFPKIQVSSLVILAQIIHETGNFSSLVYKENNNLFGMKQASVRKNTATGTNRGHATYSSDYDSIKDYFLRQENFNITESSAIGYMNQTIESGYAEDLQYFEKWLSHYEVLRASMKTLVFVVPVLLAFSFAVYRVA